MELADEVYVVGGGQRNQDCLPSGRHSGEQQVCAGHK